jgi:hypothetical protein
MVDDIRRACQVNRYRLLLDVLRANGEQKIDVYGAPRARARRAPNGSSSLKRVILLPVFSLGLDPKPLRDLLLQRPRRRLGSRQRWRRRETSEQRRKRTATGAVRTAAHGMDAAIAATTSARVRRRHA